MRAFIVRPFGKKHQEQGVSIDFDQIERELIVPVLHLHGIESRTSGNIVTAGNIREDMFRMLISSDLVVADVSLPNENVFYALGIRHALRPWRTILIRSRSDCISFGLHTDRYVEYDPTEPQASLDLLSEILNQTLALTRPDSPVYLLLPELKPPAHSILNPIPTGFSEEVERSKFNSRAGDLALLAEEARSFDWANEGLRSVARAQFDLGAFEGSRKTWEAIIKLDGDDDIEANVRLATIYQRLGDLVRSDVAIKRALSQSDTSNVHRVELYSLLGRNAKARWYAEWTAVSLEHRKVTAIHSSWLPEAFQAYDHAFSLDRNHYHSGINALALQTVQVELATALPQAWADSFDDEQGAARTLVELVATRAKLEAAVELSLASARQRLTSTNAIDVWTDFGEADLRLLKGSGPRAVANGYRRVLDRAPEYTIVSVRQQLDLYHKLGVRSTQVEAAIGIFPPYPPTITIRAQPRVVLFAGHMIDAPDRPEPRFPASQEGAALCAIKRALSEELATAESGLQAIASGSSGGDILFQEACADLEIPSSLYLALPPHDYIAAAVAPRGPSWIERFQKLAERLPTRVLSETTELPGWLLKNPNYSIWDRSELWMFYNAITLGGNDTTLIVLWDGKDTGSPGGPDQLVQMGRSEGAKIVIIDPSSLSYLFVRSKTTESTILTQPPSIFVSYSHHDRKWIDRLRVHLRPIERVAKIDLWDDTRITPGSKWLSEIEDAIAKAQFIILLISADFIASEFISTKELPLIIESAKMRGAVILQLVVGPSFRDAVPALANLQAVNDPSRPISRMSLHEREETFVRLASLIDRMIDIPRDVRAKQFIDLLK